MAEFLAENHYIQCLDLRQNNVKVGGLMALCLAMKINQSLANLDLDNVPLEEQVGAFTTISKKKQEVKCHITLKILKHRNRQRGKTTSKSPREMFHLGENELLLLYVCLKSFKTNLRTVQMRGFIVNVYTKSLI